MSARDYTLLAKLGFSDPDRREPLHDIACRYLAEPTTILKVYSALYPENASALAARCKRFNLDSVRGFLAARMEVEIYKGQAQYKTTIGFADLLMTWPFVWSSEEAPDDPEWFETRHGACLLESGPSVFSSKEAAEQSIAPAVEAAKEHNRRKQLEYEQAARPLKAAVEEAERSLYKGPSRTQGYRLMRLQTARDALRDLQRKPLNYVDAPRVVRASASMYGPARQRWHIGRSDPHLVEVKHCPVPVSDVIRQVALYRSYLAGQIAEYAILATTYALNESDVTTLARANIRHVALGKAFHEYAASIAAQPAAATPEV